MEDYRNGQNGMLASLPNDTVSAMNAVKKDFNNDFLSGNYSNVFTYVDADGNETNDPELASKVKKSHTNDKSATQNLSGAVTGINNSIGMISNVISGQLASYVVGYISNVVMTYMTDAITQMITIDPSRIMSYATQMMPNYLINAGDIMNELLKNRDDLSENALEDMKNGLVKKINNVIGDKVKQVTDKISDKMEKINPAITEIAYYSQMGPVWVQDKVDLYTGMTCETCFKEIGIARDYVNEKKEDFIKSLGDKMGQKLANKTNKKVKDKTKEGLDKINVKKQEVIMKAKTLIINVKLKLMALIGG